MARATGTCGELCGGVGAACRGVCSREGGAVAGPLGGRRGGGVFWVFCGRVDVGVGGAVEGESEREGEVETRVGNKGLFAFFFFLEY